MTLRITLRDGEKLIVNGAVLCATGRAELTIEDHAALMRGREIMSPDEANTPARRLYFACMMAYIHNDGLDAHQHDIVALLGDLLGALQSEEAKGVCASFARRVALGDFYRALADCRTLITYETDILSRVEMRAA